MCVGGGVLNCPGEQHWGSDWDVFCIPVTETPRQDDIVADWWKCGTNDKKDFIQLNGLSPSYKGTLKFCFKADLFSMHGSAYPFHLRSPINDYASWLSFFK